MTYAYCKENKIKITEDFNGMLEDLGINGDKLMSLYKAAIEVGARGIPSDITKVEKETGVLFIYNPEVPFFKQVDMIKKETIKSANNEIKQKYTFKKDEYYPFDLSLIKVDEKIMKELKDSTAYEVVSIKEALKLPEMVEYTEITKHLGEVIELEEMIDIELIDNPALFIGDEIECIRKFNKYLKQLISLFKGDINVKKSLLNIILKGE